MEILDLKGRTTVSSEAELDDRLTSVRQGDDGAFILWHEEGGPALWVHVHGEVAYLHYFPGSRDKHPGHVPTGMAPRGCSEPIRFRVIHRSEEHTIAPPVERLVPSAAAYRAAGEFLRDAVLPASISWREL